MVKKEFLSRLHEAHRAVWHHDHLYRAAVLALPVCLVFGLMQLRGSPHNSTGNGGLPPSPAQVVNPFSDVDKPLTPPYIPPQPPAGPPQKIAPDAALPTSTAPAAAQSYQSPFNQ
jgi:hypothetical protein